MGTLSTLDSDCSNNFQRILNKPEIEKMGNVKKYVTMGTQIPKWGDQGPNLRQCSLSEYRVQIKFQMFTITSAVPSDIPVLASSEQQRFAVDNQDVLPQGPVQPAHGPVGPHSGQPPPLWHNSFHSKKCCSSPSKECCSMCLQHQAWNQRHCRILKMRQNSENGAKF